MVSNVDSRMMASGGSRYSTLAVRLVLLCVVSLMLYFTVSSTLSPARKVDRAPRFSATPSGTDVRSAVASPSPPSGDSSSSRMEPPAPTDETDHGRTQTNGGGSSDGLGLDRLELQSQTSLCFPDAELSPSMPAAYLCRPTTSDNSGKSTGSGSARQEGATAAILPPVPEEAKLTVGDDHCALLESGCAFWRSVSFTVTGGNSVSGDLLDSLWVQMVRSKDRSDGTSTTGTTGDPPPKEREWTDCSLAQLEGKSTALANNSREDESPPPSAAAANVGLGPESISMKEDDEYFRLRFAQCSLPYWKPLRILALLRYLSVKGTRPIVFSGDSMVRQTFIRLVALIRGINHHVFEIPVHGHMRYCVYPTGDDMQYQRWKYWRNENARIYDGNWKKMRKYRLVFEADPEMNPCGSDVLFSMEFIWDPFQSRPEPKSLEGRPAVQVHSYMYWAWWHGMGPANPSGIEPYLEKQREYMKEVVRHAVAELLEGVDRTNRKEVERWLHRHRFQYIYVLTPIDMTSRLKEAEEMKKAHQRQEQPEDIRSGSAEAAADTEAPLPTIPSDITIKERNDIVLRWVEETRTVLVDELERLLPPTAFRDVSTDNVSRRQKERVRELAALLVQVSTVDFPALVEVGGHIKLPRKDGHFMCTMKDPNTIQGDGRGCRDPTNLALAQWVLSLLTAERPATTLLV